jgi:hypothetical protein
MPCLIIGHLRYLRNVGCMAPNHVPDFSVMAIEEQNDGLLAFILGLILRLFKKSSN